MYFSKMKLDDRERERDDAPKSNVFIYGSPVANPESVFIAILFFQFYLTCKMFCFPSEVRINQVGNRCSRGPK
jgi:hypothetical protein